MRNLGRASLSCLVLVSALSILSPAPLVSSAIAGEVLMEEKAAEPKLNVTELSLVTSDSFALKVFNLTGTEKVSFKSDDVDVASVSKLGLVTANKIGEAVITVTVKDSESGEDIVFKCKVTVGPPAISIRLTLSELTLEVGKRKTLQAILKPNTTAESAIFSSTNPDVATVSATGKVVAKSVGRTYIVSQIGNGKTDVCVVSVVESSDEKDTEGAKASVEVSKVTKEAVSK